MLPPCLAVREHRAVPVPVHVPHGDPVEVWLELETGERRDDLVQLENWTPPREIDGRLVGEASVRDPRGPAARLPHPARPLRGARRVDAGDHHPGLAGVPGPDGRAAGLGPGHPALQRAVPAVLGRRRPERPGGSRGLVGDRARRRLRPGQPAARRRAAGADGALALPADQPALRQPDLSARRADSRVRRPRRQSAGQGRPAAGRARNEAGPIRRDRPQPILEGQAQGAQDHLRGCRVRRAGRPRSPATGGARARASPLRDLGGAGRAARPGLHRLAGGAAPSLVARGRRLRCCACETDRVPVLAAVAAGRAAGLRPAGGAAGRDGAGHHARPGRRRVIAGSGRLGAAGHVRRGHHRRSAAGPLQPERPGLEPAAVAAGPAGRDRVRARSGSWSRPSCGTPAGSGSTT